MDGTRGSADIRKPRREHEGQTRRGNTQVAPTTDRELSKMMCSLLQHQSAPDIEIEIFRGDPLEYYYFMSVLKEAVEYKIADPHGRFVRLLEFTEGEAKDTIKQLDTKEQSFC